MRTHHKYMSKLHINFSLHQKLCFDDGLKSIFSPCAKKNSRDTVNVFEMKIHLVTHIINGKVPLLLSVVEKMNWISCTLPLTLPWTHGELCHLRTASALHRESQDMIWFIFYFSCSERKNLGGGKTVPVSYSAIVSWRGGSGQFVSCLISEESHLQCWTYNTCNCKAVMNSVNAKSYLVFLEHEKCNAILIWLIQLYI